MSNLFQRFGAGVKAAASSFAEMVFPRSSGWGSRWGSWLGRTRFDYASQVGDGSGNSIIAAQLKWINRNFPEAEPRVRRFNTQRQLEPVADHDLPRLLDQPNPFYSGQTLWNATIPDWIRGNAYWLKVRSGAELPVQLWWAPSSMMEPRWPEGSENTTFISHYEYSPNGRPIRIEPQDVVHFRNGVDPNNLRKGLSDFGSLMREIFTDDEAANWTSSILRNDSTPNVIISGDGDEAMDQDEVDRIKATMPQKFGGDHRGEPMVIGGKVRVEVVSWSPQQMDLKSIRRVPEERISAVIGVPAIVAGLGAGMDRSTFANYKEAREAATEGVLIPMWRFFGRELQSQLLPDFEDQSKARFDFNLAEVRTLQEDQNALWSRLDNALIKGAITLNYSLTQRGLEAVPNGDVFYLPINVTPTPISELGTPIEPVAAPPDAPKGLLSLPEHTVEQKAATPPFVASMERLRATLETSAQRDVQRFLTAQQGRIVASLHEQKDIAATLDWDEEDRQLTRALRPSYLRALEGTKQVTASFLGVDIEVPDATVQSYLKTAGAHISDINQTTKRAIQKALVESNALNEGIDDLAARIQSLTQFGVSRAETIALTETGSAQLLAAAHSFTIAEDLVEGVLIHDPDGSDGAFTGCTGRHGKVLPLSEAFTIGLAHPRCKVTISPVVRAPKSENGHVERKELVEV